MQPHEVDATELGFTFLQDEVCHRLFRARRCDPGRTIRSNSKMMLADLAGSQLLQEAPSLTFFCSLMGSINVLAECRGAAEHNS